MGLLSRAIRSEAPGSWACTSAPHTLVHRHHLATSCPQKPQLAWHPQRQLLNPIIAGRALCKASLCVRGEFSEQERRGTSPTVGVTGRRLRVSSLWEARPTHLSSTQVPGTWTGRRKRARGQSRCHPLTCRDLPVPGLRGHGFLTWSPEPTCSHAPSPMTVSKELGNRAWLCCLPPSGSEFQPGASSLWLQPAKPQLWVPELRTVEAGMSRVGWSARPGPAVLAWPRVLCFVIWLSRPLSHRPDPDSPLGGRKCLLCRPWWKSPTPSGLQIRASVPCLGGLQGDWLQRGTKPVRPETLNSHEGRPWNTSQGPIPPSGQLCREGKEPLFSGFWETGLQKEDSFLPDILFPRQRRGPENESTGMKGLWTF